MHIHIYRKAVQLFMFVCLFILSKKCSRCCEQAVQICELSTSKEKKIVFCYLRRSLNVSCECAPDVATLRLQCIRLNVYTIQNVHHVKIPCDKQT